MKTIRHLCVDVSGALKNMKRDKKTWKKVAEENGLTLPQLEERFRIMEYKGIRVIPMTKERCDGFSDQDGCPGHKVSE